VKESDEYKYIKGGRPIRRVILFLVSVTGQGLFRRGQ